ncbi:mitoguardin [Caerostris darwini]|uniref:Mitoguardin n=1 Tax=Caerostris darwini TaxID=1538125 RepID=A0AAV4N3K1_9ARAC|nr:mitoguardin [Caerostris darwini]
MDLKLNLPVRLSLGSMSMKTKIAFISVTLGVTLLGLITRLLRRHKKGKLKSPKNQKYNLSVDREVTRRRTSLYYRDDRSSMCSDKSIHSLLTANLSIDETVTTGLTPQQIGIIGMETLETSIAYWEDALNAYNPPHSDALAVTNAEEGKFTHMLENILERAKGLQESCFELFLGSDSILFKSDTQSVISSHQERHAEHERTIASMSSVDSFVSAQDEIADIADFDEYESNIDLTELILYQTVFKKLEEGSIPIRLLRTEMLQCLSDVDFTKLLFQKEEIHSYFINVGNKILTGLMLQGEKDPKDCLLAYDNLVDFTKDKNNWIIMEEELQKRGVKCLTFYDIVLDFIVLDAFEDLENPPSSVIAVVQNRWLTDGFKETALSTAVWSVLKAKRRLLQHPNGFMSHFYKLSEHLIPVLAWGFYGPNENLKEVCIHFKEEVMGFMSDIFNFHKVRFTKVEELACDIKQHSYTRFDRTIEILSV